MEHLVRDTLGTSAFERPGCAGGVEGSIDDRLR